MKSILARLFKNNSISKVFLLALLSVSLTLLIGIATFWIQHEKQRFQSDSKKIQEDFFSIQKASLQQETQTLINYIDNERKQTRESLKKDISSKVSEAHSIAYNLYENYKHKLSNTELKNMIIHALRSVRFNNGQGFFYINSLDGIVILDPSKPSREGKNKLTLKDVYGKPIIQKEIEIAKGPGEGYTNYSWQNKEEQKIYPKISFVKIFKPLNWYIGCTQYVDIYRTQIKHKILTKLIDLKSNIHYNICVYDFNGICLAHKKTNFIGTNFWNSSDSTGRKIVQEIISRGTDINGGFIKYTCKIDHSENERMIFAKSYKDWQWVIGVSVNTAPLYQAIKIRKKELQNNVLTYIIKAVILLIATIIFIIIFTRFIFISSKSGLEVFTKFYEKAASESTLIDTSSLYFKEFKKLGELANDMIVKRQNTELQLNIETAYFEQLFENSPEAIAITDNESKVIKINKQFTELFGYTYEDIKGVFIDSLLSDSMKQEEANSLNQMASKGQFYEIETIRKCKNGEVIDVSIMGNPIIMDGKTIAIFGIYRNITHKIEYEKHLTEAKNKAEESDKLKSAFLANMSHEIRTPMNHILGFTDIITTRQLDERDKQEYAALIKQSGTNLLQLINNIVDLSKIESHQIKLNRQLISVNNIMGALYEKFYTMKNTNGKNHIILKVQKALSDKDSIIFTDPQRLEQLLGNIIENAIKFTMEGEVNFGYYLKDDQTIKFYVRDTGIGIPESSLKDIFKSFRQIDGSDTREYGGTGLSLTISHRLAEILDGDIRVESKENEGSCFYISLPYSCSAMNLHVKKEKNNPYNWKGKKILVVDDEKNNYNFFKTVIEKANAEVFWAQNGMEAVALTKELNLDVILMDIQMPVMDGYEATQKIKLLNSKIPIIAQTAYFEQENKEKVMLAGCDDYITKPISTSTLLASIHKQIGMN